MQNYKDNTVEEMKAVVVKKLKEMLLGPVLCIILHPGPNQLTIRYKIEDGQLQRQLEGPVSKDSKYRRTCITQLRNDIQAHIWDFTGGQIKSEIQVLIDEYSDDSS